MVSNCSLKTDFADNMAKCIPDVNILKILEQLVIGLKGIKQNSNYKPFLKQYDFRRLGKIRMDSILNFVYKSN